MAGEEEITSDSLDTTETDVPEALLDYVRNQVVDYFKETKFSAKIQHTQGQSPKLVLSFGNTAKQNQGSSETKNTNTICVENLPPTADEDLLEMFFESTKKYGGGPVKEVRMIRDKNIAFVKFCEVSAVETVIKKKPIMLGTTELYVKPYKSLLPYNETISRVQVEGLLLPKEFTEGLLTKYSEQVPISGSELAVMIKPSRICIKRKLFARSDRVKSVDLHPSEPWMLASLYNGNVHVWNFESQQLIKSFEVCDNPVRNAKFVARKNWILTGSDDMQVRCYNYNTLELVRHFEAHSDYIRCIAVHPTQPFFLTSSDDTFIKCWDWEKKWSCTRVFEGHTHYVMQIAFNPNDNNTFASASLDRSIKVWQLGSCTSNFTLEGHEKGVNCVAFYNGGDKPYLISGADDKTVKIWDYQNKTCIQTLEGHAQNISAVSHHPKLPIILTGSEDGTVKIWHKNTYRHCTLNYGLDRVWTISCQRGSNYVALGYDEGSITIKVGEESKSMLEGNKDGLQPEMEKYDLESHTNALPGLNKRFSWAAMASKNTNMMPPMDQKVTQHAPQRPSIDSRDIGGGGKRIEQVGPSREDGEPWGQGMVADRGRGTRFPDNQQLFVGNLPNNASEKEIREFFDTYGTVVELRINRQSSNLKVPNFGFVVFNSPDPVQHIISHKPIKFNGEHRLNVEEKRPRDNKSRPIGWGPPGMRGGSMNRGGFSRRGR